MKLLFINIAHAGVISDAPTFKEIGANVLFFLLSLVGIIAIISLLVSGIIYIFSAGDERKIATAKRSTKYSIIGIVIALSGIIIIKTIGKFLG